MSHLPVLINGSNFSDERGKLIFNNNFNAAEVKRIYFIESQSLNFIRAWQGHRIEKRWFICVAGSFEIKVIKVDHWNNTSKKMQVFEFLLNPENSDILHVPAGYFTSIKSLQKNSKLMAMSDYLLGEINDEYRLPWNYFS